MTNFKVASAGAIACLVAVSGCESTEGSTNWNRMLLSCGAGAVAGSILGAVLGGGKGAAIGAAGGLGVGCAIALALDQRDKQRIADAQKRAVETGTTVSDSWTDKKNVGRVVRVASQEAPPVETQSGKLICRRTHGTIKIEGTGETELPAELYCRTSSGDWVPYQG